MKVPLKLKHRRFELKTSCDEYHRMFFLWMEFASELAKNKRPVTWFTGRFYGVTSVSLNGIAAYSERCLLSNSLQRFKDTEQSKLSFTGRLYTLVFNSNLEANLATHGFQGLLML